jgi:hypothetical protein
LSKQRARKASEYSPSEGEEEKNPPRGLSIRRSSGGITLCARGLCRRCRSHRIFKDSKEKKAQEGQHSYTRRETQVEEFAGRKEQQRLEPLKDWNSSKSGKKAQQLRRRDPSDRPEDHLDRRVVHVQEGAQESAQDRGSEPSDLEKKSRQPLDLGKLRRV